jgi:UDP-N-acetylmuramoylalanine--D-glutamate ligase
MSQRPELPPGPYLIVGLGRSGIAAARALRARDASVAGYDAAEPSEAASLRAEGVELRLGEASVESLLEGVRTLVKSPGVPDAAPVIAAARERGLGVLGELELAWRLLPNEFIAVTGTNGKTTTVELIGHIHRQAGRAVAVAGNVGTALSSLVGALPQEATVACEVSSFQLQDSRSFAPEVGVLLNVAPDHLDRHETMEAYLQAKLKLFARQREHDFAIAPPDLLALLPDVRKVAFGRGRRFEMCEHDGRLWWRERALLGLDELPLRGRHNVENAMAAAAACLVRGLRAADVRAGLRSFGGVPHRLQEVARHDGVLYVNDSKATNVASTLVALEAFAGQARVHLILGGQGKGQDFAPLREPVEDDCAGAYLIGEDAAAIERALAGVRTPVLRCGELDRAVHACRQAARPGEVVLLSPACASFDQFSDFEARGERFCELVREGGFSPTASK